jgi:cytidine deaminase
MKIRRLASLYLAVKDREETMIKREELLAIARKVALKAHCPYSHFRVGSALIAGGKIYVGVNVEISSYGLTLCAERSAIAAAIADGVGPITEIAVACIDVPDGASINKRSPCRTCRQWLVDLAPEAIVYMDGVTEEFYVSSQEWLKSCSRGAFRLEDIPYDLSVIK